MLRQRKGVSRGPHVGPGGVSNGRCAADGGARSARYVELCASQRAKSAASVTEAPDTAASAQDMGEFDGMGDRCLPDILAPLWMKIS